MRSLIGILLIVLISAPSYAISPRGKSALRNVQMTIKNIKKDPSLFDGKAIVPGARMDRIKNYLARSKSNLNRAIRGFNRISASDRSDPQARKAGQDLRDLSAYINALEKAYKGQSQAAAGADNACRAFEKEAMTQPNKKVMRNMVLLLKDQNATSLPKVNMIKEWVSAAKAVKAICSTPKYKDVGKVGCRWMKIGGKGQRDPSAWCEAANQYEKLVQVAIINHIQHHSKVFSNIGTKPEELAKSAEGYIRVEGPVTYKSALYFGPDAQKKLLARMKPLLDAGGIKNIKNEELFAQFKKSKEALRAKVDELAPTWKSKSSVGKDYSCNYAKRTIKKWHRKAAIKKVYLTTNWTIRKNAVGVPLERMKSGIIIFKLPGEKWCQSRGYTVTETYKGGGRYQKAKGVRIGYVRFQKACR